ncbi:MAG: ATP-dependent RNA helicase HrpA, partial [Gammaproteobacteria bacterium]|nr:ATP-dependent RNA helicase HrpA [Gammaproteobacteria bacterium]
MPNLPRIKQLSALISTCLSKDQFSFKSQLKRLASQQPIAEQKLITLQQKITRSAEQVEQRHASCPSITYPDLPISAKRDEIAALIKQHQVIILCGETGSGKTTQLPKICLELGRGFHGQIGHTQPRRLAAITVAQR